MSPQRAGHRYAIDFFDEANQRVGTFRCTPDWGPLAEWAYFVGIRGGRLPATTATPDVAIEPVWAEAGSQPVIGGIRAIIDADPTNAREGVTCEVPYTYLRDHARTGAAQLVEQGVLETGQTFRYVVSAFPQDSCDPSGDDSAMRLSAALSDVVDVSEPLPIDEAPLAPLLAGARMRGEAAAEDFRVLVPDQVVAEIVERAQCAGEIETGGVLLGRLCRSPASTTDDVAELYLQITAQIPALHSESRSTKLTFTAETWGAVQGMVELRGRDELVVGWWHSHPDFCKKCPVESRRACAFAADFFSNEDVHLHRTCFPRAWQVALLASDHGGPEPSVALFAWRSGSVVERAYYVMSMPRHEPVRGARPPRSSDRLVQSATKDDAPNATDFARPSPDSVLRLAGDASAWETTHESVESDREEDLPA